MQNSFKCIKKKQTVCGETHHIVPNNKLGRRLQLIEEKLNMPCPSTSIAEETYTPQIKNLPFGKKGNEDVNKFLRTSLGFHMNAKTVDRARSISYNAGVITLGLRSEAEKEQVMRSKHKLRYTDSYYDVYIDDGVEQRIQQKLQVLMNTVKGLQQQVPCTRNIHPQRAMYKVIDREGMDTDWMIIKLRNIIETRRMITMITVPLLTERVILYFETFGGIAHPLEEFLN